MPRRRVSNPIGPAELDAADRAMVDLAKPGWSIRDAVHHVPAKPGIYAIHAQPELWPALGLGESADGKPLYVGKAEQSLAARDIHTHFASGRTGSSTVRRSFAALLKSDLNLSGVPRSLTQPAYFANYALTADQDAQLTEWMLTNLTLSVWVLDPPDLLIGDVEAAIIRTWTPPVNIEHNPKPHPLITTGREALKLEARQWAVDRGFPA
jgi:hypothetical protein